MQKQEQLNVLNRVHTALGLLKIEGVQAELLTEIRKGVALVNNAINTEIQTVIAQTNGTAVEQALAEV
jgi:hypothetical protein